VTERHHKGVMKWWYSLTFAGANFQLAAVHFLASTISFLEFFLSSFLNGEVYISPITVTQNNLKYRTQTAIAETEQPLLQTFWREVK